MLMRPQVISPPCLWWQKTDSDMMGSLDMFVATKTCVWRQILLLNLQSDVSWLCFVLILCLLRTEGIVFSRPILMNAPPQECFEENSSSIWGSFLSGPLFQHHITQDYITQVRYWSSDTNLSVHLEASFCWIRINFDGRTPAVKTFH